MKGRVWCIVLLALAACGDTIDGFDPVVDGPKSVYFDQDLADCRALAKQTNDQVAEEAQAGALVGAVIGAAIADKGERTEGAVAGAAAGALGGAAGATEEVDARKERIVVTCMQRRGHNVLG